jgi:CheY-like chemotaxis protein
MNLNDKLSILYVEDNELNQKLIKLSLKKHNYFVYLAENGFEGVQMFKKQKFDLILMDLMMPVMNGFEATNEIRNIESKKPELGRTPIVALTANNYDYDREKCVNGGMEEFLEKPFDINKFREVLCSLS